MLDSDRDDRRCVRQYSIAVHILQYQSHTFLVPSNATTPFDPCMRDAVLNRYVESWRSMLVGLAVDLARKRGGRGPNRPSGVANMLR